MKHNYLPESKVAVEGIVPLSQGGTNANTIEQARVNLGIIEKENIGIPLGPVPLDPITGLIPPSFFENIVTTSVELDGPKQVPVDTEVRYTITNRDARTSYIASTTTGQVHVVGGEVVFKTPHRYSDTVGFTLNGTYFRIDLQPVFRIPNTPAITNPIANVIENSSTFTFTCSPWSTNYPEDSLDSIEWEVSGNQSFTNPLDPSIVVTPQGTTLVVSNVPPDTRIYARVRFFGYYGYYSEWSPYRLVQRPVEEKPGTPTITSPSVNGILHDETITVETSGFVKGAVADTHLETIWQHASNAAFTEDLVEVVGTGSQLLQLSLTMDRGRSYHIRARHKSNLLWESDWSVVRTVQYVKIEPPERPTITSPSANVVTNSASLSLTSSTFAPTAAGDTFGVAEWQRSTSPTFSEALKLGSSSDPYDYMNWDNDDLEPGKTYYYRVRYQGESGWYSDWSLVRQVIYGAVLKPLIVYPTNNQSRLGQNLTIVGTGFSTLGLSSAHSDSDWQVATDPAFNYIVKSSLQSQAAKTSWQIEDLSFGLTFYVRVRYRSVDGFVSPWSDAVMFKTKTAAWDPLLLATITIPTGSMPTQDKLYNNVPSLSVDNNGKLIAFGNHVYFMESAGPVLVKEFKAVDLYPDIASMTIAPISESINIAVSSNGGGVEVVYGADVSGTSATTPKFILAHAVYTFDAATKTLEQTQLTVTANPKIKLRDQTDDTIEEIVNEIYIYGATTTNTQGQRVLNVSRRASFSSTTTKETTVPVLENIPNGPVGDPSVDTHMLMELPVVSGHEVTVELVHKELVHPNRHYTPAGWFEFEEDVDRDIIKYYRDGDTSPFVSVVAEPLANPGTVVRPVDWKPQAQWMKADATRFITIQNGSVRIYDN